VVTVIEDTATAGQNADIVLANADGTTNQIGIHLLKDDESLPGGFRSELMSKDVPHFSLDEANYGTVPESDVVVWDERCWCTGFGLTQKMPRTGGHSDHRYGYSDGVLAFNDNRLTMGYQEDAVDIILQNGRFETGDTTGWDNNSNASVATSTDSRSGNHALTVTLTGTDGYVGQTYRGTLSSSTLNGETIIMIGYVKRVSGSGSAKLVIDDDQAGQSNSSTTTSTAYNFLTVERTVDGSAGQLDFRIQGSTSSDVWRVDDLAVYIKDRPVTWAGRPQEFEDNLYAICGPMILKWNETDDAWYPVHVSDEIAYPFTSLLSYEGNLYAGRGTSTHYMRSADGTTWADPSSPSGNPSKAEFFARVRNANGDWALMKTRANQAAISVDPTDTAKWGNEIQVGDSDRSVTNVWSVNDTAFIGKEDGIWGFSGATNRFEDLEPEANFFKHSDNYKAAQGRGGQIYASGGDQSFWEMTPIISNDGRTQAMQWRDVDDLVHAPNYEGFGGKVQALADDRRALWVATDGAGIPQALTSSQIAQTGASVENTDDTAANWDSPSGITADDGGSDATASGWYGANNPFNEGDYRQTDWLYASNFNNSGIPDEATIVGYEVEFETRTQWPYYFTSAAPYLRRYRFIDEAGNVEATSATFTRDTTPDLVDTGTYRRRTIGGPTQLLGLNSLTVGNVQNSNFGVQFQYASDQDFNRVRFDYVRIKIYFTVAGGNAGRIFRAAPHDGNMTSHTVTKLLAQNIDQMSRYYDGTRSSLFVFGRSTNADASDDEVRAYRLRLPVLDADPTRVDTPQLIKLGRIATPWMDWFFPDIEKGLLKLSLLTRNTDATNYITAYYKSDNAEDADAALDSWTLFGTSGIFNTAGSMTLSANMSALPKIKRIRFLFVFTSDSTTQGPELLDFALHAAWNDKEVKMASRALRRFRLRTRLGDKARGSDVRQPAETLSADDLDTLYALAAQPVIQMRLPKYDRENSVETLYVKIKDMPQHTVFLRDRTKGSQKASMVLDLELVEQDVT